MARPVIPPRAKLVAGLLCGSAALAERAEAALTERFGRIDHKSAEIPFDHSDYYAGMGPGLTRTFVSFEALIERERIAGIKLYTNGLELILSQSEDRIINIDPGYLTLSNLFLASCKEYYHRAYLTDGVYIENEYRFTGKRFVPWEWTYPDYKTDEAIGFFQRVRETYHNQLRAGG